MSIQKKNILFGLSALMMGGLLYILFRESSHIGSFFSNSACVRMLRSLMEPLSSDLAQFYLPDLLWVFSLSCGLLAIGDDGERNIFWCGAVAFGCGCCWELLQFTGAVSGTGDGIDVLMYLLGSLIFLQINLKERNMKRINALLMALLIAVFAAFALGSGEGTSKDQGKETAGNDEIGKYSVVIDSCRLAKDYTGEDVVIVKYVFTNVADEDSASFFLTFDDTVYQNGVGLNEAYVMDESANYSADNQTKEIKKGASIDVEVAYVLNDTTTDIDVELKELFSFEDTTITKTFSIA